VHVGRQVISPQTRECHGEGTAGALCSAPGHHNQAQGPRGGREANPPHRRQPSDREGRWRRPRAGLHRRHARLEKRCRTSPRRAHRAHLPTVCARRSNGTHRCTGWRAKAGSSASIASRSTSRWLSSAARRCVLFPPGESKSKDTRCLNIHEDDQLDEAQLAA
jgi:hypothetical protein